MKLLKVFSGLVVAAIASLSISAQAVTLVPVSCSWTVVNVVSIPVSPGGTVTVSQCKDGSTLAATKAIGSNGSNACGLNAESGYQVSGNCYSPSVYRVIPDPVCPTAGNVYPQTIYVGQGQQTPFPADAINAFCTANTNPKCGFTTTVVSQYSTSAILKATCVTK
jgi:hypothetical protein